MTAGSPDVRASQSRFRADIQGLRAIAVGAVLLYHAGLPFIPGGYVGVDVFFVISGFLITSHLLSSLEREGRIRFASFYAKRARRILPTSFLVLVLSIVAALIWYPPLLIEEVWKGAVATALYAPNYLFAVNGTNYLAETTPSLFQHYWSLGIEEQFYLVWPLLLAIGWRFVRSRRALFLLLIALIAVSFTACVLLTFRSQPWAFFSLPTRAWELGIGGAVAFALTRRAQPLAPNVAAVVGWMGVAGIVLSVLTFSSATAFPGYWALLPVVSTAAVILAGATPSRLGPTSALSLRAMTFIGAISYSLYLVHWPALVVPQAAVGFGNPLPLGATVAIAVACVPVAWLMYKYVENPARNAAWLAHARPARSLVAAGAASLVAIAVATGAHLYAGSLQLSTSQPVPATVVTNPPQATDFVPANLTPSLRAVSEDQPILYAEGCHRSFDSTNSDGCLFGPADAPRIALFGDSHAAQWFPALHAFAEQNGYAVETYTKSSCPSISALVNRGGVPYTECSEWRDGVIERLNDQPPALVVLANYGVAPLAEIQGDYEATWESALGETLDQLVSDTAVVADTPDLGETPSVCLSAHLDDVGSCAVPRAAAVTGPANAAERAATSARGVPFIDLTDYICGADTCAPVVGNTLVYRDAHHLTATFSTLLRDSLGETLRPLLP